MKAKSIKFKVGDIVGVPKSHFFNIKDNSIFIIKVTNITNGHIAGLVLRDLPTVWSKDATVFFSATEVVSVIKSKEVVDFT